MKGELVLAIILIVSKPLLVSGHGRLVEPPSRSSMWRFGFKTKPNYNDNELFCGGYTVQWQSNGGKCGVCGDAWHLPRPRPNEAGGTYGNGIIVRKYSPGQVIMSTVQITANHKGFFEFKLCPHNSPKTVVTQECLDRIPLELADGSGTRYYPAFGTGPFNVQLKLPEHVTCSQCVFQWTYTAGNNWGRCEDGKSRVGCGPQETFRGCADIKIDESEKNDIPFYEGKPPSPVFQPTVPPWRATTSRPRPKPRPTRPIKKRPPPRSSKRPYTDRPPSRRPYHRPAPARPPYPYNPPVRPTQEPSTTKKPRHYRPPLQINPKRRPPAPNKPAPPKRPYNKPNKQTPSKKNRPMQKPKPNVLQTNTEQEGFEVSCKAVGAWKTVSGIAKWCEQNCPRGYCPPSHCDCTRK